MFIFHMIYDMSLSQTEVVKIWSQNHPVNRRKIATKCIKGSDPAQLEPKRSYDLKIIYILQLGAWRPSVEDQGLTNVHKFLLESKSPFPLNLWWWTLFHDSDLTWRTVDCASHRSCFTLAWVIWQPGKLPEPVKDEGVIIDFQKVASALLVVMFPICIRQHIITLSSYFSQLFPRRKEIKSRRGSDGLQGRCLHISSLITKQISTKIWIINS